MTDEKVGHIATEAKKEGSILIALGQGLAEDEKQVLYIGIGDEGGTSATSIPLLQQEKESTFMFGDLSEEKPIDDEEEVVLATIAYTSNEYGFKRKLFSGKWNV